MLVVVCVYIKWCIYNFCWIYFGSWLFCFLIFILSFVVIKFICVNVESCSMIVNEERLIVGSSFIVVDEDFELFLMFVVIFIVFLLNVMHGLLCY